jgi:signal transduction histidine kinase
VVIEIEDTGCGIPEDQLVDIFREFEQADVVKRLGRRNSDVTHRSTGI